MVVLHVGVVVVIADVSTAMFADAVCSCYCRQRVVNRSSGVVAVAPAVYQHGFLIRSRFSCMT